MENKCSGCGAKLQCVDEAKIGFIDSNILYSEQEDILCKRCYNLIHYNKDINVSVNDRVFFKNASKISKDGGLVCYVIDMFDFEATYLNNIRELFPNNRILVILNKYDLFLKSTKASKIKNYALNRFKKDNIKITDCILMSANNRSDIDRLIKAIYRSIDTKIKSKNIYFFGLTNVGKSTILKEILKTQGVKNNVTVSNLVNTTLDFIKIPMDNGGFICDTPGVINDMEFTYYLKKDTLNYVLSKKFIKPNVYQLNEGQTLFINGFCSINYLEGEKNSFVLYFSNLLKIHRTKYENSLSFYEDHKDDLLIMPDSFERENLGNLVTHTFDINEKSDICISGLGFVTVENKAKVSVRCFEKIKVVVRKSIYA